MIFSSLYNGQQTTQIVRHTPVQMLDIPALAELHPKLVALGWQQINSQKPLKLSISAKTINGQAQPLEYYLAERILYQHKSHPALLAVEILSGHFPTPEEPLQAATCQLDGIYKVEPVAAGKGQLIRVRQEAVSLLPLAESLPLPVSRIVVSYRTRGGRGGWIGKVADRRYTPAELKAPPKPTRAQQFPSIRCPATIGTLTNGKLKTWGRERPRTIYARPEGLSDRTWGAYYTPTAERFEGEWVVCKIAHHGSGNVVLLLKETDYQRLMAKKAGKKGVQNV